MKSGTLCDAVKVLKGFGVKAVLSCRSVKPLQQRPSSSSSVTYVTPTTMVLKLYSLDTPNGQKVGIALEELGLLYEKHVIDIRHGDQHTESFLKVSPNGRIPAIVTDDGFPIFESGAILLYLAEKTGKLLPTDEKKRFQTLQWLFWQMGGVGPMFGQFGHFYKYAPEKIEYGINRYAKETMRLLGVLDKQLEGKDYVIGDEYTIADIAIYPWVRGLSTFYNPPEELVNVKLFKNVQAWLDRIGARPAVQRGLTVTPFPSS